MNNFTGYVDSFKAKRDAFINACDALEIALRSVNKGRIVKVTDAVMSAEIRSHVKGILKEQMEESVRLVSENKDRIDSLVAELLIKNHMTGDEIDRALRRVDKKQSTDTLES